MSGHVFEHPDRSRMIERSDTYASSRRRSSPSYRNSHLDRDQPREKLQENPRKRRSSPVNGNRDRSRSPYRRSHTSGSKDLARSRSPKRRRRRSRSVSVGSHRYKFEDEYKRTRRRISGSRSPHHPRESTRRARNISSSPRPRRPSSPNYYKHSKRRDGTSRPPRRRHRSTSNPPRSRHRHHHSTSPSPPAKRSKAPLPSQQDAFNGDTAVIRPDDPPPIEKQKPSLAPTGVLAKETNTAIGTSIVLKYNEPPESRLPPASAQWRMYVFKGAEELEKLQLYTRSCWLFGRERAVVDLPIEHPSCSKQHAVIQFRYTEKRGEFGDRKGGVKPYIIDLDSANGTMLNGDKVEGRRYMELRTGDVLKFGESTREYVLLLPPKL